MLKLRTALNILFGRIRYLIARSRKRILEVCVITPGQWRWSAFAILIMMALFMVGMGIDFIGELNIFIFLAAVGFFFGLSLLAGLGVRLALNLLKLLPEKQRWIYFAALFFIFFIFGVPEKAKLLMAFALILSGSFLGAGIFNLTGGRWGSLTNIRRVLTLGFLTLGAALFLFGWIYMLYPGKAAGEVKAWSMEAANLPELMGSEDPSRPGPFAIDSLTYGWGKDKPRKEFGSQAELITKPVDGSNFLDGWEKLSGKLRTLYWKMGPDSLALNGTVWYPLGEGPFPLVLMVHGNHLDRDFSDPGYGYLGRHFATHGIIAVSVDENFLNGAWSDFSSGLDTENDCRGWLLLKHLEQWREWNQCDTVLFYNKVDLNRVVLIGHSRGGEAVSVASCFNHLPYYPDNAGERFDFNFGICGIAAIAPVDGQYWPGGIATPLENVNYFTIQGSMDADLRSYDGLRQMRRVQFNDSIYHFASGLYLHGANHGQFNQSWGIFDNGYPNSLLLNRKAIIPVEQQEKVALVYLSAFVFQSLDPVSGYLPLFKDYRTGRNWLPGLVYLNQFSESSATILCDYEEDLDLTTGSRGVDSIEASGLALWKEGRIPKKWGDYRNNGVFLGWNNEDDSIPGHYRIVLDSSMTHPLEDALALTFLAADAQIDPGERPDTSSLESGNSGDADDGSGNSGDADDGSGNSGDADDGSGNAGPDDSKKGARKKDKNADKEEDKEEDQVPIDFQIVLTDTSGFEYRVRLGDFQKLQPAIKPEVFKSRLFWDDAESEVVVQYVCVPLERFRNGLNEPVSSGAIRSICFLFDAEKKGTLLLDQLGFAYNTEPK
jgi:dienelactone hydrolase